MIHTIDGTVLDTPRLVLVRGLPGSGKSTFAKRYVETNRLMGDAMVHLEADMFHMKNGVYDWNPENVKAAHEWCQTTTRIMLEQGVGVVVSNTFTQKWEMQPYIDLGYKTRVYRMRDQYENIHNVPDSVIQKMADRFEKWPREIVSGS